MPDYQPVAPFPPGELIQRSRWVARQAVYGEALDALDPIFASLAIEYMPIKGAHLVCTGLAADLETRTMHDIDLLVRPRDFERAIAALAAHPLFIIEPPDPWPFEQPFIFRQGSLKVRLELHRALNRPERFVLDVDSMFDRALLQTSARRIMQPEDALIVLVCHTLVHLVDGIPAHIAAEGALLVRTRGFSWERFAALLRPTGIERFGKAMLTAMAAKQGFIIPQTLHAGRVNKAIFNIRTPLRHKGIVTSLFRGIVELYFVKDPIRLLAGYIRGWK